jgi:hypothetical protein
MKTDILTTADALSDRELLAMLPVLAGREREASVELVAHLAALDARPSLYLSKAYGSLHSYCTEALRLSEDAASNRIAVARACRRFPVILELLASGEMTLTSVRLLGRHLTPENHQAILLRARRRTLKEIDLLVAELDPQPDAPTLVRKMPTLRSGTEVDALGGPGPEQPAIASPAQSPTPATPLGPPPVLRPTAPERYRVQFTIGEGTHEKLRRLQDLLRREIPDGDPGAIFDRAITLLLAQVENRKLGVTARPRPGQPIRRETDDLGIRTPPPLPRTIPRAVKRGTYAKDEGRCRFVSAEGSRCTQRVFLEFHHVETYAKGGEATPENISLRCRAHNQYEATLVFGPRAPGPPEQNS